MSQLPQTLPQMIITKVFLHERGDSSPDEDHNAQPSYIIHADMCALHLVVRNFNT